MSAPVAQQPQFFVGWATLASIIAGRPPSKHRRGLNGFFASILRGPIATLILVACEPHPSPPRSGAR